MKNENKHRVTLLLTDKEVEYIKTKFEINNADDLTDAIYEMISTYMEM